MTSSFVCCFSKDSKLLKIYERGKKLVDKEFDVLQLFKSKKHDHIKKKEIDIDEETQSDKSDYSNSEDEIHYKDEDKTDEILLPYTIPTPGKFSLKP
jgi:hypothetical protein